MDVQRIELEADRIVAEELDRARQKIIENHVAVGQRTTGHNRRQHHNSRNDQWRRNHGDDGRPPIFCSTRNRHATVAVATFSPTPRRVGLPSAPKWFIDIIADWAATKGVDISAWGAATKIMTEGSALFRNGGRGRHLHARNSGPIRPHRR